jgi:mono/diheme cytochrome c family protein
MYGTSRYYGRVGFVMALLVLMVTVGVVSQSDPAQDKAAMVERGRYLTVAGGCGDCHSPKVMTDAGPVEDSTRLLSGHPASESVSPVPDGLLSPTGWMATCNSHLTAWAGPWGVTFAVNLTPHKTAGIGSWSADQFVAAMRSGKHRGFGRAILPPMPWYNYARLTDDDLEAVFAYLQTLKPVDNKVPDHMPPN